MLSLFLMGVCCIGVLLLAQTGVRHLPVARHFKKINDIVGFYMNLIGVIYAVVLTFVMVAVWEDFEDARRMVEAEANALKTIYLLADGLPQPVQTDLKQATLAYADRTIELDWPMMEKEQRPTGSESAARTLWKSITDFDPKSAREQELMSQLLATRVELHNQRQDRLYETTHLIPDILWLILLYGGLATIGLCFMFGVEQAGLHQFKTAITGSFIILILVAIWELDRPFARNVHITPEPFEIARASFQKGE